MTKKKHLKVRAPAKLILSGEHAVVYGHPALAMAINRHTEASVCWSTPFQFTFNLLGIDFKQRVTLEALKRLKRKLNKQYQQFSRGNLNIREVLNHPFELTLYTAINVIDKLKHKLPMGIDVDTNSTIPMGCGLGSSAASVVSMIMALCHFLDIKMDIDDYLRLGIESENLQHGFSSGLDLHVSYQGGATFFSHCQFHARELPKFPMQLIHTGTPSSSTGECVAQAKPYFKDSQIGCEFSEVTQTFDAAIRNNTLTEIKTCIRENHRLLQQIGVVPNKVSRFISAIEEKGGAAKICGAGSIRGDAAGVLLVVSDEGIDTLTQQYDFQHLAAKGDRNGATVLSS